MKPFLIASIISYVTGLLVVLGYHGRRLKILYTTSLALLCLGLLSHSLALGIRMYSTGHAPMANMYETLVFYAWCSVVVSAIVIFRYKERSVEIFTVSLAIVALFFGLANEKPGGPLTLILRTVWFEIHVTSSFAAYALFSLAFSGALIYLITSARKGPDGELRKYQDIAARGVLWGFFFFSASMFSGAVWGYLAWGAYWLWEPKVIWSFIVWFYYAGAMHAYYVKAWRGKGLAVATVIGLLVVGFTYLGVSLLMKSSHSFGM